MLAQVVKFEEQATLIMSSGLQFMDFGLTLELRKEQAGEFLRLDTGRSLARLEYNERTEKYYHPGNPTAERRPDPNLSTAMEESIKLLDGLWLPIPVLRANPGRDFEDGPTTWSRARIVTLAPGEDLNGFTHRLTLAFDTSVFDDDDDTGYLAPRRDDVKRGAPFQLAHRANEMGWFPEIPWIVDWLEEVFRENAPIRLGMPAEDIQPEVERLMHHAHYLNFLALIGAYARIPEIKLLSNQPGDVHKPIPVDMVLDVGNSRTCGILIEDHPQEREGLRKRYELELRDLSRPHQVYAEPFESRSEFAQAAFGKEHFACQSGRNDAFVWPTISRVGPEATRLASRRRGTEGSTGLSSPKRYLWDEDRYEPGWRFNSAYSRGEVEPLATAAPFSNLINETGSALYSLPEDERIPVFMPHYSRSALMTFMLAEVLVQALCQINSPAQRLKQSHSNVPRHLRQLILTVPPSMPKPERQIFRECMRQAVALVWKAFNWHPEDDGIDEEGRDKAWPPFPEIQTHWDEATCAQVVYLFSETQNHFGGRPEDFFRVIRRPHPGEEPKALTIASIDIGGGTTDLVVTDYRLDAGRGGNVSIQPVQRFRDGFKVAGDDILLDVIQAFVVPTISDALKEYGIRDPAPLLSRMIGFETRNVQESVLRQQLALQVMYPLGLKILKAYERYDPVLGDDAQAFTIGELLGEAGRPSDPVLKYFSGGVREEVGGGLEPFDLLSVRMPMNLNQLHGLFLSDRMEICKTLRSLCEIVYLYDCDVLLVTGRPSRLPGIQALLRALLAMPPDRIIPLNDYRTGTWYPFHKQGRIDDPKTTAAVGAMLCVLGQGRIPNFFFRANVFRAYSTVRNIGLMDTNNMIKADDVYYAGVNLDDENYELPDITFEMRGRMTLGFRQLDAERWGGSALYVLDFADEKARQKLYGAGSGSDAVFNVALQEDKRRGAERFKIKSIEASGGQRVNPNALRLQLNTLNTVGVGETSYWLDTGSIVR